MKVSIITAVYNNVAMIQSALDSVFSQTYDNIEYVVIDGGSTDGTVEILGRSKANISVLLSEPDTGIYDALNKGVHKASGDIICFLHADDIYDNPFVIQDVVNQFSATGADSVYGDLVYVAQEDTQKVVRLWKSGQFSEKKLHRGWMPPHPAFFVKRMVYEKVGGFDTTFRIAADYDFILRVLGKEKISTAYLPKTLYRMRVGGVSNRNLRTISRKSKEDYRALKKNGIGGAGTLIWKNLSKVPQFFLR